MIVKSITELINRIHIGLVLARASVEEMFLIINKTGFILTEERPPQSELREKHIFHLIDNQHTMQTAEDVKNLLISKLRDKLPTLESSEYLRHGCNYAMYKATNQVLQHMLADYRHIYCGRKRRVVSKPVELELPTPPETLSVSSNPRAIKQRPNDIIVTYRKHVGCQIVIESIKNLKTLDQISKDFGLPVAREYVAMPHHSYLSKNEQHVTSVSDRMQGHIPIGKPIPKRDVDIFIECLRNSCLRLSSLRKKDKEISHDKHVITI